MTSKKLYLAKLMENVKRRNWTFLLCAVTMLLVFPVNIAIQLTSRQNSFTRQIAYGMTALEQEAWRMESQTFYLRMAGISEEIYLFSAMFAVLFAVQGFSWLYSRRKMDFYMSMPVCSIKRYLMIMGNGILVFGVIYLVCTVLGMAVGAAYDVLTFRTFGQILLAFLMGLLNFTAVYQVALTAVMLTGNVLTALLGCSVFFFYEPLVRLLINGLKETYYVTYCSAESSRFMDKIYWTPAANGFLFFDYTGYSANGLICSAYGDSFLPAAKMGIQVLLYLLFIAVWGMAAYILYRKRKTESYGWAIAFQPAKGLIRVMLLIPLAVGIGMFASLWAGNSQLFLWAGAFVGLILSHGVIQLIYERDLKAIGKRFWSMGISGIAAALVLAVFTFDLTGYDSYVPDREEVASVSVTVENDYSGLGRHYAVPFTGSRMETENILLSSMNSQDPATIDAVLSMAKDYVSRLDRKEKNVGPDLMAKETDFHSWIVRYELKNGREVYRTFESDAMVMTEQINTVMRDEAYQNIRCQLFDDAFVQALDQMKVIYSNGVMEYLYTMDREILYRAYAEEMRGYDYDLITGSLPCGMLTFSIPNENKPGSNLCYWELPVYESFEKTLTLIGENKIPVWEKTPLHAEDVESIQVDLWFYEETEKLIFAANAGITAEQTVAVEEKNLSVSIEDPMEIQMLLQALYPQALSDAMDQTIHRYDAFWADAEVTLRLSAQGKQKRIDTPHMYILKEQIPEFLSLKLQDAWKSE